MWFGGVCGVCTFASDDTVAETVVVSAINVVHKEFARHFGFCGD